MKSMTGFGRARVDTPKFGLVVDATSVNKRGLEIFVSLPRDWQSMELAIAQKLKKFFARGKISLSIKAEFKSDQQSFSIDAQAVNTALKNLEEICATSGTPFNPSVDTILKINESLSSQKQQSACDWEEALPFVEATVEEASTRLDEMRIAEGVALAKDLEARLATISEAVEKLEIESRGAVDKYKEQLLQRLANSGLELDVSDERVLKEVCLFADKSDICEEITRLKSHISQFLSATKETEAVGRKMDFICQEMGREINTTASKAGSLAITKIAIDLKNELERIREQIQNVE